MSDLLRLITLQDANTRVVLLGTALLGGAAGLIGCFTVLRRRSLVGDALAHAALPGVAVAYLVIGQRSFVGLLLGALCFGLLAVACLAAIRRATRIKEDAAIGIVLATFFGLGIVLSRIVQNQPGGNRAGLDGFIFGKAASMTRQDVAPIAVVAGAIVLFVVLFFKELRLLCFDRDFAASEGWPVLGIDLALLVAVCLCTVAGLPAVGVVLMVALLVIPAAAARFWSDRLIVVVLVSGAIGLAAAVVGTSLSAVLPSPPGAMTRGWPTGPLIALSAAGGFVVSLLLAPRRGLLAEAIRRRRNRRAALEVRGGSDVT